MATDARRYRAVADWHHVTRISGGALSGQAARTASTTIHFADVDDATIDAYAGTASRCRWQARSLDGLGGWSVDRIDGDPSSVVGIIRRPCGNRLQRWVDVTDLWRHGPDAQ